MSKKVKGLMDMGYSVVIVDRGIRGLNGNGKKHNLRKGNKKKKE